MSAKKQAAPAAPKPRAAKKAPAAKAEAKPQSRAARVKALKEDVQRHILSFLGNDAALASKHDYFKALAYTVRERMAEAWIRTQRSYYDRGSKRVYYLSLE